MPDVYGSDLIAKVRQYIGQPSSDGTLDAWNAPHPWAYWCEALAEGAPTALGLAVTHYGSAAEHLDAITAAGLLRQGTPEHGAWCLFGRAFDPNGHICFWDADKQQYLGTLTDGTGIGYHDQSWTASLAGWCRVPGILAPYRAPVTPPAPPVNRTPPNNPYGAIEIAPELWPRFNYMDSLGLAYPMIGFPRVAATKDAAGVVSQRFERGTLTQGGGPNPWDIVLALAP
jgi:hypothetical protein